MLGDDYQFVSPDPARPWPGVARDIVSWREGLALLCDGSSMQLDSPAAVTDGVASLLTFPVAALSRAEAIVDWFDAAYTQTSAGGVVVAEEPGIEATSELEPVTITPDRVVLASVEIAGASLDVRVVEMSARQDADADNVAVSGEIIVPVSLPDLHQTASQSGWEVLGQWSDWDGQPIDDRWRIVAFRKLR
ncbi:MAG: hypothetical protein GXP35_09755 [Actinobacteria bacterium]|nr:hypothetical protein [Actinomycetota bacterium]